ncbi:MAG: lipase family protein [Halioglobus sp.]
MMTPFKPVTLAVSLCAGIAISTCSIVVELDSDKLPPAHAVGDSNIGAFYRIDKIPVEEPGTLLRQEPLEAHQSLEYAAANVRLLYTSTEGLFAEDTIAVSGALFLPEGTPPEGGWPLLAWTHGTVGVADICAPSWNGRQSRDTTYLNYWLANGYAIVASDYQGLGTPGTHPYLATRPEAYSNLDAIRAVQRSDFPVSDAVVLFGQSQGGGAALATGGFAQSYAPELDVRGIVATGPPYFSAEALIALGEVRPRDVIDPKLGYNFLAMTMLEMIDPTFKVEDYASEKGLSVAKAVDNTCYVDVKKLIKSEALSYDRAFTHSPTVRLGKAFERMEYVSLAFPMPVFIGTGGKDKDAPVRMQQALVRDACKAGSRVQAEFYVTGTHGSVVNGSTEDSSKFVSSAFARDSLPGNCENLPY